MSATTKHMGFLLLNRDLSIGHIVSKAAMRVFAIQLETSVKLFQIEAIVALFQSFLRLTTFP